MMAIRTDHLRRRLLTAQGMLNLYTKSSKYTHLIPAKEKEIRGMQEMLARRGVKF